MKKIFVYPHSIFEVECEKIGVNDDNVKEHNIAFIDIIGTQECLKYYLEEDTKHWFNKDHDNVLNLEFDDIPQDEIKWHGHIFKGFSMEQAERTFNFIENNLDKNFQICCRAGMSRSQAIGCFINNFYNGKFESDTLLPYHYNRDVYGKLAKCYYKKYNHEYEQ